MQLSILIYHLDPDEEQEKVISSLETDGLIPAFKYEDASNDRNAISINIGNHEQSELPIFLDKISNRTLSLLYELGLKISLIINVESIKKMKKGPDGMIEIFYEQSYLSPEILNTLGLKRIAIYVNAHGESL